MTVNRIIPSPSIHDSAYDNPAVNRNPNSSQEIDRIKWVDTAKALGLFLVFWGHILYGGSSVGNVINRAIYSFHMPIYFILSGYVIKTGSECFPDYFRNKFYRIFLPALLLYLLTLPVYFYFLDYDNVNYKTIISTIFT